MVGTEEYSRNLVRPMTSKQYIVEVVSDGRTAIRKLEERRYQAVVVDLDLPGKEGLEVLGAAVKAAAGPAVIACGRTALVRAARGTCDFLEKPVKGSDLVSTLKQSLERRRMVQELVSMRKLVDVFGSLQNLEKTYSHLRKSVAELFQAQACSMALLDAEKGEIVAQTSGYGARSDSIPRHRYRISESRVSKIMLETGEPFLSNSVPQDPLFHPADSIEGLENLLAVPMRTAAGPIGFIYLVNRPGGFTQLDAELLVAIGKQVAVAIQNAHSFDQAYREAITDPLTGLYNRRFFDARLRQEVERVRRAGRPIALAFVDLDGFKQINDRHGHQAGNLVLWQVARVIRQSCRASDVPARWGGDEFTILLTEATRTSMETVARRVREGVLKTNWGQVGEVTVAMGLAMMPQDGDNLESLLRAADDAMYLAKRRGGNSCAMAQELRPQPRPDSTPA